ncbi:hypothetical protein EV421DRAFT_2035181, partial [Armillaria borealis]
MQEPYTDSNTSPLDASSFLLHDAGGWIPPPQSSSGSGAPVPLFIPHAPIPVPAGKSPYWGLPSLLGSPDDSSGSSLNTSNSDPKSSALPLQGTAPIYGPFQGAHNPSVAYIPPPPPSQLSQIIYNSPFYFHGLLQNNSKIAGVSVSSIFNPYFIPEPSRDWPQDLSGQKILNMPVGPMPYGYPPSLDTPHAVPSETTNRPELLSPRSGVRK